MLCDRLTCELQLTMTLILVKFSHEFSSNNRVKNCLLTHEPTKQTLTSPLVQTMWIL